MNKAFRVEKKTVVTKETDGVYFVWNVEFRRWDGVSFKKCDDPNIVSCTFFPDTVYLKLDGDLIEYPTDIETIKIEPEDGWWVVEFEGGGQCARRKHREHLYEVGFFGFNKRSHWTKYEFIDKIAEPS